MQVLIQVWSSAWASTFLTSPHMALMLVSRYRRDCKLWGGGLRRAAYNSGGSRADQHHSLLSIFNHWIWTLFYQVYYTNNGSNPETGCYVKCEWEVFPTVGEKQNHSSGGYAIYHIKKLTKNRLNKWNGIILLLSITLVKRVCSQSCF